MSAPVFHNSDCVMCSRWQNEPDLRIHTFEHSYLTLNRDQFFPGYCLLSTKDHVTELFHLDEKVRHELIDEVSLAAEVLADIYRPTKINYELLGNMVPHIHWHLVPRFDSDPLWPKPIWSEPREEKTLTDDAYVTTIAAIKKALIDR